MGTLRSLPDYSPDTTNATLPGTRCEASEQRQVKMTAVYKSPVAILSGLGLPIVVAWLGTISLQLLYSGLSSGGPSRRSMPR